MPLSFTIPEKTILNIQFPKPHERQGTPAWWGPVWRGLFVDPAGKHYHAMGKALWLYGYLIVHANRKTGTLYRSLSTITRDMQIPKRTIQAWLSVLRKHGYIKTKTTGRALLIEIEKWRTIIKKHHKD